MSAKGWSIIWRNRNARPVSYTHLDVYKRQHLEYVFDCIDKNTTKVGNIKAYLLAALYNAPATMDSYYRAEVNHDLYGC